MAERRRPAGDASGAPATPSFEEALERLETIVDELEGGALSLEDSIARYEEGIRLSKQLTARLDEAEKRIERLVENGGPGGAPATEPMELEERNDRDERSERGERTDPGERAEAGGRTERDEGGGRTERREGGEHEGRLPL